MTTQTKPDFSGYATRYNVECSDGRTIRSKAFQHMDKKRVPLMWQHSHNNIEHVLGYADLEHREDGTYAYAYFNDTELAKVAKSQVLHGDITALSIYAKNLRERNRTVEHGDIKEVSLVLAGANVGAYIDNIDLRHSDDEDALVGDVVIYTGEEFTLSHADSEDDSSDDSDDEEGKTVGDIVDSMTEEQKHLLYSMVAKAASSGSVKHSDDEESDDEESDDEAIQNGTESEDESIEHSAGKPMSEVIKSFSKEQRQVVELLIGEAISDAQAPKNSTNTADVQHSDQEGPDMTRNLFENNGSVATESRPTLSHSDVQAIVKHADRTKGKFSEAFADFVSTADSFKHADGDQAGVTYGITDLEYLFPDARTVTSQPELIARQAEWVPRVLAATKKSPFARIKSITADITAPEARAKGYIKGNEKVDEVVKLLKRDTGPTTIYKKQKLDRDDIIDITDLDVVAWLKWEIKFMLDEEVARAILIGDGREYANPDKIKDPEGAASGNGIRSIAKDNDLYAVKIDIDANVEADQMINKIARSRTQYRGSGSPTLYTTDALLTDLLLLPDRIGRRLYATEAELASALRVKEIVAVEVMEEAEDVLGIVVNLTDYTVGTNKGGEINFFSDFDIDFNQEKYLMETRMSGALTKPKSALVLRRLAGTRVSLVTPSFNGETNTIAVPVVEGVDYVIDDAVVKGNVKITKNTTISARAQAGFYIAPNTSRDWTYAVTTPAA